MRRESAGRIRYFDDLRLDLRYGPAWASENMQASQGFEGPLAIHPFHCELASLSFR